MFIIVLNLALPAVQIFLASLLFNPVRAAAAPALGKALSRAVHTGNLIAAKTIWLEAEVGKDLELFQRMLPHLRFLLDVMARSGFKELNKLSEGELVASQGIAEMLASGEAHCLLQFRELGNSGAKVVAEAMKHTTTEELNLDSSEIGADGAEALGEGLKENRSLQRLYLYNNSIGDAGAKALGQGLKENRSLQKLGLIDNSIGDVGAQALGQGLRENRSLQKLFLDNNSIGDSGAQALAAGIIENRSLTYLRLDRSLRDTPGGQALEEAEEVKKARGEDFEIVWW